MISKRILISMIVIISLAEFITCPSATQPDPAAGVKPKTGVKPRDIPPSKSRVGKPGAAATKPTDPGMDPDDGTSMESEKPNGIRQKFLKPIKLMFRPLRFLWRKFKDFRNKVRQNNKGIESDGEKPIDKNRK